MNKKVIILSIAGVALVAVLYMQFMRESPQDREYRENMERSKSEAVTAGTATTGAPPEAGSNASAAPGATPTATGGAPGASGPQSQFISDTVNVDELLASIKEVDFTYDRQTMSRDPLRPLVGDAALLTTQQPGAGPDAGKPDPMLEQAARTMKVSGIMWDEKEPLAVVDDNVVGPGYTFPSGIVVESITRTEVVLNVQNKTITLELKEQ